MKKTFKALAIALAALTLIAVFAVSSSCADIDCVIYDAAKIRANY